MKTIIFTLMFLIANVGYAYDVPKDAVIKVFTKDGKQIGEMSRQNYKVVKIEAETCKQRVKRMVEVHKMKKNDVILHGGIGRNGLKTAKVNNAFQVQEKDAPIAGLTYCRNVDSRFGFCGSAFTNASFTLGVKLNF